jgi:beta-glucanase (GH16 family)
MQYAKALLLLPLLIIYLDAKPYKGAELRTTATMLYGKFEVRLKSAAGSGLLSSFFTYYDGGGLPANWNEIDIEIMGRYTDQVQFNTITNNRINHVQSVETVFNPHESFHTYAIAWTPDYAAWSIDGYEVYRQTGSHIQELIRAQKLMMNIWPPTSVEWAGTWDESILPVYAYYDWIKYYAYDPENEEHFNLTWQDDFSGWDQSRWAKATHTFDENNCDFITDNCVFKDGYMILCLTNSVNTGYDDSGITDQDIWPPVLIWGRAGGERVMLFFSEPLDPVVANQFSHYNVAGSTVHNAELQSDSRTVILTCDPLDPGAGYNIIVSGIKDIPGNTAGIQFKILINALTLPVTINCGGPAQNGFAGDQQWEYDKEYGRTGGTPVTNSALVIGGTNEPELYTSELRDPTFYSVRLFNGTYRVVLKFAETQYTTAGQRIFDVFAEGEKVIENLDIYNQAGALAALEIPLPQINIADGMLDLYFKDVNAAPVISGITIEKIGNAIRKEFQTPHGFDLKVYPNPFNQDARLKFILPTGSTVNLMLFDLCGRKVKQILQQTLPSGEYQYIISGYGLSSGVYFLSMLLDDIPTESKKIILLK